jgi:hypothetical protein
MKLVSQNKGDDDDNNDSNDDDNDRDPWKN